MSLIISFQSFRGESNEEPQRRKNYVEDDDVDGQHKAFIILSNSLYWSDQPVTVGASNIFKSIFLAFGEFALELDRNEQSHPLINLTATATALLLG